MTGIEPVEIAAMSTTFCTRPCFSVWARSAPMALPASGKGGTPSGSGPSSRMMRLTMPRAGRPEKRLVSAVWRAASLFSAARCNGVVSASGQRR